MSDCRIGNKKGWYRIIDLDGMEVYSQCRLYYVEPAFTAMHTIGAFAVVFDESNRVLLCHRTDHDMWNLPGGRVEPQESPWAAVVREVEEEVGLLVRVERLLGVYSIPQRTDLVLNFLCAVTGGASCYSPEADDIRWFDRKSIPENTLPRHLERIEDAYSLKDGVCLKVQV